MASSNENKKQEKAPEEKKPASKSNSEVTKKAGRRIDMSDFAVHYRKDVGLPWDKEWLKKSRDDLPSSDQPVPENPLMTLKPHGPAKEPRGGAERGKGRDS